MEFELGLKISRTKDDFSSADLRIAKDRSGPVFISRETDALFILTAYLKGYRREWINIEINEDGSRIVISGEKPVQEMVMVGWTMYKKETEMRGFKKGFKIPDGVILDEIKARFDEEESTLTVSMPKLVKGIRGEGVEEVIESEAAATGIHPAAKNVQEVAGEEGEVKKVSEAELEEKESVEKAPVAEDHDIGDQIEATTHEQEQEQLQGKDETQKERRNGDQASQPREKFSKKHRVPIVAGSAILVSVIVFVIHLIRTKNPPSKRRN